MCQYVEGWNDYDSPQRQIVNNWHWGMFYDKMRIEGIPLMEKSYWPTKDFAIDVSSKLSWRQKWKYFWLPTWTYSKEPLVVCYMIGSPQHYLYSIVDNRFVKNPYWQAYEVVMEVPLNMVLKKKRYKAKFVIDDYDVLTGLEFDDTIPQWYERNYENYFQDCVNTFNDLEKRHRISKRERDHIIKYMFTSAKLTGLWHKIMRYPFNQMYYNFL
jgi:hypothetical protein